jgi:chitodextrinase
MPISPMTVGETHVQIVFTWKTDPDPVTGVQAPVNLTGATITVRFVPQDGSAAFTGAGTIVVTNAVLGQGTYTFNASDVATSKAYKLWGKASFADGTVLYSDPVDWLLRAAP